MPATTIPENPKPGERFAVLNGTRWEVYGPETYRDGNPRCIADGISELDARLLVHGGAAVAALRQAAQADPNGGDHDLWMPQVDAALANFPEAP